MALASRSRLASVALLIGVAAVYFVAGKVGLDFFGKLHPSASAVWPPTGVAIAGLLIFGYRVAGAVFVGAFFVNYATAGGVLTSLGIAAGNTLEGVVAAYLVVRFAHGAAAFERAIDLAKYAALAAGFSTALSATIGVGILSVRGPRGAARSLARSGSPGGSGTRPARFSSPRCSCCGIAIATLRRSPRDGAEASLLFATVIVVTALLFFQPPLTRYPLAFLCMPPLVWAAFRFRPREVDRGSGLHVCDSDLGDGYGQRSVRHGNAERIAARAAGVHRVDHADGTHDVGARAGALALLERERAALAEAEAALRSSDIFLATLSHELRNPLSAIGAAGAVLEERAVSAEAMRRVGEIIQRQTAHLKRLLADLLDVARITSGNMQLERRPLDLTDSVTAALQSLGHGVPPIELDLSPVQVDADPDRLQQLIGNLLGNAIKFTPGTGHIRVRTFKEGHHAVLCVEDSGVGIPVDMLPRVFDLFYQGRARSGNGLGVGLAVVRRIAELHGGSVEARSRGEGLGSTFTVRLPVSVSLPPSEPLRVQPPAPAAPAASAARHRILLVEDNADVRESLRLVLESAGHELIEAADGESGVERAIALRPQLALIDIGLPGIDGCEVAKRIRAADTSIRLVALTGYGRDRDLAASRVAGFDAHLVKPVIVQRLGMLISELLDVDPAGRLRAP